MNFCIKFYQVMISNSEIKIDMGNIETQTKKLIAADFPRELKMSNDEYADQAARAFLLSRPFSDSISTLVEPRINFLRQTQLLGIHVDPSIYNFPITESGTLKVSHLQVINRLTGPNSSKTLTDIENGLQQSSLRTASPFEALVCADEILRKGCVVALMGGELTQTQGLQTGITKHISYLVLETHLGKPRISYDFANSNNYFVGVLAARTE